MMKEDIRDTFREFNKYRNECMYSDCMHDLESDCQIKKLVKEEKILLSRYENFLKF